MLVQLILGLVVCFSSALCDEEEALHPFIPEADVAVIEKCLKAHSLTRADFPTTRPINFSELPENHLCFIKCTNEEMGILDKDGVIVIDKVREYPDVKMLDEVKMEEMLECIGKLDAMKTCKDIARYQECSTESLE